MGMTALKLMLPADQDDILGYNYMLCVTLNTILFAVPEIRCDVQ